MLVQLACFFLFVHDRLTQANVEFDYRSVAIDRGALYTNYSSLTLTYGNWSEYKVLKRVGKGKFSVVHHGRHIPTKKDVALKFLIYPVEEERIKRELKVMETLRGTRNTVQLLDLVEEPTTKTKVVVMSFVQQLSHYKILFAAFKDWDIRHYLYEVLIGLDEIHSKGLIHRDLKPLNIVCDIITKEVNICDWGTADFFIQGNRQKTKLGTKQYKAPELLLRKWDYDFKLDMWTVGVTLASMIFKLYPFFDSKDDIEQLRNIATLLGTDNLTAMMSKYNLRLTAAQQAGLKTHYPTPDPGWEDFMDTSNYHLSSPEAWNLLNKLLVVDPELRLSAKEAMAHDYFKPIRECWTEIPPPDWPDEYEYTNDFLVSHDD